MKLEDLNCDVLLDRHVFRWNVELKKPMRRCMCGAKRNYIYTPTGWKDRLLWWIGR